MAKQFELLVLYTSTPGFGGDVKMAEMMKDLNPKLKVAFVGPPVTTEPEKTLLGTPAIDFVVRREFDYQIVDYARGKPLEEIAGVSFRKNGQVVNNRSEDPAGNAGHRFRGAARIRLPDRGLRQGQTARRDCGCELPQERTGRQQPGSAGHRRPGRPAVGHKNLQARLGHHALQRAVSVEPLRLAVHVAGLPGAVYVLPVAANPLGAPLAAAFHR